MIRLLLISLMPLALVSTGPKDFDGAIRRSEKSGKPVLVLLGADWCRGCRVMKKTVIPKLAQQGGLENVEYVYLDVDRQPKLADQLLRGNSIPQLVELRKTADGWSGRHLIGTQTVTSVKSFVKTAIARTDTTRESSMRLSSWPSQSSQAQ